MQLDSALTQVHDQLAAAASLGDERTREIAARLATAAEPAVRLAVLAALSAAADEITAGLLDYPGSPAVSVRLDGEEITIDIRASAAAEADVPTAEPHDAGDTSARISLRLSESLKTDIDAAAERDGVSVNTWLIRAATAALRPGPFAGFGPGSFGGFGPFGASGWSGPGSAGGKHGGGHRITGWING